jgi:cytidine deaminase
MVKKRIAFEIEEYPSAASLSDQDRSLLEKARSVTEIAYAPYSKFRVGAAARMKNGQVVEGSNQENASYPIGICAERVLMSVAAMLYPEQGIDTMAISYHNQRGASDVPISPCGMCRQAIHEFELRTNNPMRVILSGLEGKVWIISKANDLLPLSFDGDVLID